MTVTTSTAVYTRVHTATYLTEVVLGAVGDILAHLGLSLGNHHANFAQNEAAIAQWIIEQSLETVILECTTSAGRLAFAAEFPVTYAGNDQQRSEFVSSRAALGRYRAKLASVPAGSTYRLVCTFRTAASDMPGWSSTTRASTAGLNSYSFGSLASAPHASASLRIHMS